MSKVAPGIKYTTATIWEYLEKKFPVGWWESVATAVVTDEQHSPDFGLLRYYHCIISSTLHFV